MRISYNCISYEVEHSLYLTDTERINLWGLSLECDDMGMLENGGEKECSMEMENQQFAFCSNSTVNACK